MIAAARAKTGRRSAFSSRCPIVNPWKGEPAARFSPSALQRNISAMTETKKLHVDHPMRWSNVYREADLFRAAVRVYTKPLFQWRKALSTSTDGRTLYDFASRGLHHLDALHSALLHERFEFRPAIALHYNFNGKHRTLYITPWEERIVDLLLYRAMNRNLHSWFSTHSFAYRDRSFGLDHCQSRIADFMRRRPMPVYLVKRDIRDYFASIDHETLLHQLAQLVHPTDYLYRLLEQRVRFAFEENGELCRATRGVPFGTSIACFFANLYLTEMDRGIESIPDVSYFRYADDLLVLSTSRERAEEAAHRFEIVLTELSLRTKESHQADLVVSGDTVEDPVFKPASHFRHLGLMFRHNGEVALSRDKLRKIQNLFRFGFRRGRRRWKKLPDPLSQAQSLITIATDVLQKGVRNVAIVDYYLKHVSDEKQLALLDRWLAEEVLSLIFGGHKKNHFRRISFEQLRTIGLPSLVHRKRLIRRGKIESPFFIWQRNKATRAFRGTVARP